MHDVIPQIADLRDRLVRVRRGAKFGSLTRKTGQQEPLLLWRKPLCSATRVSAEPVLNELVYQVICPSLDGERAERDCGEAVMLFGQQRTSKNRLELCIALAIVIEFKAMLRLTPCEFEEAVPNSNAGVSVCHLPRPLYTVPNATAHVPRFLTLSRAAVCLAFYL